MKVLLIDVDSKWPNIALMKLSTYYKNKNCTVELCKYSRTPTPNLNNYDKVFASLIFTKSKVVVEELEFAYPDVEIEFGGTGYDLKKKLKKEIDDCDSDYELYDVDYGIGFSARGCTRKCEFCVVNEKEGSLTEYKHISRLINPKSKKLMLLDNNFTSDKNFKEKAQWLIDNDIEVNLQSGVDVRTLTTEKAKLLNAMKHEKSIHIAWDLKSQEEYVIKGIEIMIKEIKPYKIMCYVLVGFNTNLEYDLYRIKTLKEYGINPFVMNYNNRQDGYYKHLARFVNTYLYRNNNFKDYEPYKKLLEREKQQKLF